MRVAKIKISSCFDTEINPSPQTKTNKTKLWSSILFHCMGKQFPFCWDSTFHVGLACHMVFFVSVGSSMVLDVFITYSGLNNIISHICFLDTMTRFILRQQFQGLWIWNLLFASIRACIFQGHFPSASTVIKPSYQCELNRHVSTTKARENLNEMFCSTWIDLDF